ncbi:hypothetical protein ACFU5O_31775 [Streptomyces sp. NPDC057445]|uniref:hypothetical protein n=1 Tax=Streptomyces sp. NPDC057445 TaxID=3346136 RepID=UPI00368E077C
MRAESSSAARTGALIAVTVAPFRIRAGFFALDPAVPATTPVLRVVPGDPGHPHRSGVTAPTVRRRATGLPPPSVHAADGGAAAGEARS